MDLGIGAVSLTFQVFSGCMKGYQLLTEARGMEAEHKYMRIQLKKEQHRLLDWGHVAGVGVRDDGLVISRSDKGLLHDVLEQQQSLLLEFGRYEARYKKGPLKRLKKPLIIENDDDDDDDDDCEPSDSDSDCGSRPTTAARSDGGRRQAPPPSSPPPPPPPPSSTGPRAADTDLATRFPAGEELLQKALGWAWGARGFPRRLRWAAFDKARMEALLLRLASLNDFLREMLTAQQLARLDARQERTRYHIIQLNNKVDQLVEIFRAGSEWSHLLAGVAEAARAGEGRGGLSSASGGGGDGGGRIDRLDFARRARALLQDLPPSLSRVESMDQSVEGGKGEGEEEKEEDDDDEVWENRGLLSPPLPPPTRSLSQLAQFKALETAVSGDSLTAEQEQDLQRQLGLAAPITDVELDAKQIALLDPDASEDNRRTEAVFAGAQRVWVEWKTYEPRAFNGEPDGKVVQRLEALVVLLKQNGRAGAPRDDDRNRRRRHHPGSLLLFRAAPRCLGYFRDVDACSLEDRCRFGLVFAKPPEARDGTRPTSLLDLLRATAAGALETPSLTERARLAAALAKALEELHAVNWLHKGLRSENVLFFADGLDPDPEEWGVAAVGGGGGGGGGQEGEEGEPRSSEAVDFAAPYLSGFDYARPAMNEDMTEKPPENAGSDIYRHPSVQGSRCVEGNGAAAEAASFQKTFDIYALGVVLLEIAYWQPIDLILGVDLARARPSTTLRVRERLLQERKLLAHVRANAGVVLEQVIRRCLKGAEALVDGAGGDFNEKDPIQAARLQAGFYEHVVEKLAEVKI